MSHVMKRLDQAYENALCLPIDERSKIVLMSDCHRGIGNWGDNFQPNQNLFFAALQFYNKRKFTYIELGDGDELWENRNLKEIIRTHSNQFWMMSEFYREGRLYMLYGNHDRKKEHKGFWQENCHSYYCESEGKCRDLFPGLQVQEAIRLQEKCPLREERSQSERCSCQAECHRPEHCPRQEEPRHQENCRLREILLVHGHQGDFWNDTVWRLTRFLVRYIWRPLELMGCNDPTSAAKNYRKKEKTEERLAEWANEHETILVAGHTHRPVFPKPGKGYYFNDGSCVHPRCITALEIERGGISLVKWSSKVREDNVVYIGREVLEGPVCLKDYFSPVKSN